VHVLNTSMECFGVDVPDSDIEVQPSWSEPRAAYHRHWVNWFLVELLDLKHAINQNLNKEHPSVSAADGYAFWT
jgi:hypothetical protein